MEQINSHDFIYKVAKSIKDSQLTSEELKSIIKKIVSFFDIKPIIAIDEFQEFRTIRDKVIASYSGIEHNIPIENNNLYPFCHILQQATFRLRLHSIFSGTRLTFDLTEKVSSYNLQILLQRVTDLGFRV